ncbi:YHS domain-containing (seleno)protein [uncultured Algimonas sp.]|uniref:YHS domain-containing (seleno)protein n=1 Tax=uncultured Algimonas sp. TaxID=1547920 RepID=UPI0026125BDE|nr:YHS domain-containing (seleno)protein [uncultured Algimonas sp.]
MRGLELPGPQNHIHPMKTFLVAVLAIAGAWLIPAQALAQKPEIYTSWRNNLALDGYDVVSFHAGKPLKGRTEFSTEYRDAVWRFDTQANLDLFEMNPQAFAPQYGGYCAWAAAMGKLAPGKARHWHVVDGRLYLNYSTRVKKRWDALREEFIVRADENWPDLLDE